MMLPISSLLGSVSSFFFVMLSFLFVLTVVVFVHELGHFLVARWCGVKVKAFSIGFGREVLGFNDRYGTRWRVSWIPLGGYVKFMDDENAASAPSSQALARMSAEERAGSFHFKPLYQRAAVVAAGPIANFLLAIVIFAAMYTFVGVRITEPRVDEVVVGTPAEKAGFKAGDVILSIDGGKTESFNDVLRIVSANAGRELAFQIDRRGELLALNVTPEGKEVSDNLGGTIRRGQIGIKRISGPGGTVFKKAEPIEALWLGVTETQFIITSTLQYLGDVVTGRQNADQLGGPLRIAHVSGEVARLGFEPLMHFIALISVSIGLINLFPIPLLDGGHLLFYAAEAVRGRPLSERTQEIGFRIGLAVVLMLMAFAFWNDRVIPALWFRGNG
jgi:regulator of sigma E protease